MIEPYVLDDELEGVYAEDLVEILDRRIESGRADAVAWTALARGIGNRTSTALPLAGFRQKGWPDSLRIGGRIPPECLAGFNRNTWPDSTGIPGRFAPEYADRRALGALTTRSGIRLFIVRRDDAFVFRHALGCVVEFGG